MSEVNQGPISTGVDIFELDDLSVATDSGWRELEEARVAALKQDFKENKYGTGNFSKPTVIVSASSPEGHDELLKSAIDGNILLDNGVATIQTLKELKVVPNLTGCDKTLDSTMSINKNIILQNWACPLWKLSPDPVAA